MIIPWGQTILFFLLMSVHSSLGPDCFVCYYWCFFIVRGFCWSLLTVLHGYANLLTCLCVFKHPPLCDHADNQRGCGWYLHCWCQGMRGWDHEGSKGRLWWSSEFIVWFHSGSFVYVHLCLCVCVCVQACMYCVCMQVCVCVCVCVCMYYCVYFFLAWCYLQVCFLTGCYLRVFSVDRVLSMAWHRLYLTGP